MLRALISWLSELFGSAPKAPLPPPPPSKMLGDAPPPNPAPKVTFPVPTPAHFYLAQSGVYPETITQQGTVFTMGMIHSLFYDPNSFSGGIFDGIEPKGQQLPTPQNEMLTSLLMSTYGGDLPETLGLPDLRGSAMWGPSPGMTPWPDTVPVTWLIATASQPPPPVYAPGAAAPLAGMIMPYAGQGAIAGWLPCTGGTYDPQQYPELAAAIGSNFDPARGNEGKVYPIPDLGWRVTMGAGGPITGSQGTTGIGDIMGEQSPEKTLWALCVTYLICLKGPWPYTVHPGPIPATGGWIGQIVAYGGLIAPADWAVCDGSLLQIEEYMELFAMIGSQFGGDGAQTFAVPDLRGKMMVGSS